MTEDEIEIAQWRIDTTGAGEWKIDEIYSLEIWKEQPQKNSFGGVFKKAVLDGVLKGIKLKVENGNEILSSDRQLQYLVSSHPDT